jgi:hypothetical protein
LDLFSKTFAGVLFPFAFFRVPFFARALVGGEEIIPETTANIKCKYTSAGMESVLELHNIPQHTKHRTGAHVTICQITNGVICAMAQIICINK